MLVVGEKEAETESVAVRQQGQGDQGTMSVEAFVQRIKDEVNEQLSSINIK